MPSKKMTRGIFQQSSSNVPTTGQQARLVCIDERTGPHWVLSVFCILFTVFCATFFLPGKTACAQGAGLQGARLIVTPPGKQTLFDMSLTPYIIRLSDPQRSLSFRDVVDRPDQDFVSIITSPGAGYTRDAVWYRAEFEVESSPNTQTVSSQNMRLFLEVSPPYLDRIDVAIFSLNEQKFIWRDLLGDIIPVKSDTIKNRNHTARLPDLAPGKYQIIFQVKTTSANLLSASFSNDSTLMSKGGRALILSSILVASLVVIGGVYFIGGLLIRDVSLFWYGSYVLSAATGGIGLSGLGILLLQPLWTPLNNIVTGVGSALSVATSVMMWITVINLRQLNRRLYRAYCIYAGIAATMAFTATTPFYTDFGYYFLPFHMLVLISLFCCLIYRVWLDPRGMHLFYLLALGIPCLAVLVYIASLVGLIPANQLTQIIYPVSTLFHLILMGMAMAYRTSYLENARVAAQSRRYRTRQLAEEQREFITMLGHEFRTPLAIIQRSAELISLHLGEAGAGIVDRMARIRSHAGQLSALVDVFLTKDTLDRGAFTLNLHPVNLLNFLSDIVDSIDQEGTQIDITLHGDASTAIMADPTLLKLAIANVIENARKYAPGSPVSVDCNHRGDGYAYIRVLDHGPGMNEEDLSQVSMAFYRGKTSDGTRGVGLGLHIASRILEAHNGSITMSVAEKGGTTVVFKLPIDRDATIHNIRHNSQRMVARRNAHNGGAE
jgi:signal transduction histidine kinase